MLYVTGWRWRVGVTETWFRHPFRTLSRWWCQPISRRSRRILRWRPPTRWPHQPCRYFPTCPPDREECLKTLAACHCQVNVICAFVSSSRSLQVDQCRLALLTATPETRPSSLLFESRIPSVASKATQLKCRLNKFPFPPRVGDFCSVAVVKLVWACL